jgi:hypothetical protein
MSLHPSPSVEIDPGPFQGTTPTRSSRIKAAAWTLLGVGFLALFAYRAATFTPAPLDTPGTLRPILYRWFLWFVTLHKYPEQAFSTWSGGAFALSLIPAGLALLALLRNRIARRYERLVGVLLSRPLLFAAIAVALVVCRFPSLLENELNPDEGQFIASAHKLFYDANYFRSVDCGTSGPLNIYPLMLPAIFGFSPDYASSRLVALSAEFLCVCLLFATITRLAPEPVARFAVLPLFGAFTVFRHQDLVHYSSEHIPILLITLALYCAVRVLTKPQRYHAPVFFLGLLSSAAFFTKMQALPMVCALAAMAGAYVYATRGHGRLWTLPMIFATGLAPIALAIGVVCWLTGTWHDFWMAYIVTNGRYADFGGTLITDLPPFIRYIVQTLDIGYFVCTFLGIAGAYAFQRLRPAASERRDFLNMAGVALAVITALIFLQEWSSVSSYAFVAFSAVLLLGVYVLLSFRRGMIGFAPVHWFGVSSAMLLAAALFSVYKAHRTFPHYLLFIFVPISAVIAWMLIRQARLAFLLLVLALTIACQSFVWGSQDDQIFKRIPYTVRPLEGPMLSEMTVADDLIEVWGWTVRPYLGSGRAPATRDTNMANFFRWPEISAYYEDRFLRDMREDPPALFIDAVGPTSWDFNDRKWHRFEEFPRIKAYIEQRYVHLVDLYEQRYFLRRDLVGKRPLPFVRDLSRCERTAVSCLDSPSPWLRSLPPVQMPGHALLELRLTPSGAQNDLATVVSNSTSGANCRGFRLYRTTGDSYRIAFGVGTDWVPSKELSLPAAKTAHLWIELNGNVVTIRQDGDMLEQLYLPRPMADSPSPVMVGSWVDGTRRFAGSIEFFQIVDLEKEP